MVVVVGGGGPPQHFCTYENDLFLRMKLMKDSFVISDAFPTILKKKNGFFWEILNCIPDVLSQHFHPFRFQSELCQPGL